MSAKAVVKKTVVNPDKATDCDRARLRREQILDAAADCFSRRGFHAAGMAEIAKSFGMSASHIYNYFDSKEAIIAAIVERGLQDIRDRAERLARTDDVLAALIDSINHRFEERLAGTGAALDVELLAEASRNPAIAELLRRADAEARAKVYGLFKAAHIKRPSREIKARVDVLFALRDGLGIRTLKQSDFSQTQMIKVLREVVRGLLED